MTTLLGIFDTRNKMHLAFFFFVIIASITPAKALQLKCKSEVSVSCLAKKCHHEKDDSHDTVTILLNIDKKLIIRTATSERRGERTAFCDISWDYQRTGISSNLVYDAFYICSEDPEFPDTGMITILEYTTDEGTLFNDAYHEFGITTSSGACEFK